MDIKDHINPAYIKAYEAIKEREDAYWQDICPLVLYLPHGIKAGATSFVALSTISTIEKEHQRILEVPQEGSRAFNITHTLVVCMDEADLNEYWRTFAWAIDKLGLWKCYSFERGHRVIKRIHGDTGSGRVLNEIVFTTVSPEDFVWKQSEHCVGKVQVYSPSCNKEYPAPNFSRLIVAETARFGASEIWQIFQSLPNLQIALFDYHPDTHKRHWLNGGAEMWGSDYNGPLPGDRLGKVFKATYQTMPREWLQNPVHECTIFVDAIMHEMVAPEWYRNTYLGEPIKD